MKKPIDKKVVVKSVAKHPLRPDHRTRVALARREKTRSKLLKAAIEMFALHGFDASAIDRIINQAGVSRGTFYNYFRTTDELFFAAAEQMGDELVQMVDPLVLQQKNAVARVACGMTQVIGIVRREPVFAQFILRGGPAAVCSSKTVVASLTRDIGDGLAEKVFDIATIQIGIDLVVGITLMAFSAIIRGEQSDDYFVALVASTLQALGVSKASARIHAKRTYVSAVD